MSTLRQDAIMMVQSLPENQLAFVVNILKELSHIMPENSDGTRQHFNKREQAFQTLESMRRKITDLDYEKELTEYREGKYL